MISLDSPPEVIPSSDRRGVAQGRRHVGQQQPTGQDASIGIVDLGDDQPQRQWWPMNFDLLAAYIPFARSVQDDLGLGDVQPRRPTVISPCASVLESVFLMDSIGNRNQRSFLAGAEDLAIVGADQRQVSIGASLQPMIDRIRLTVDQVNQGCVEAQAVDVSASPREHDRYGKGPLPAHRRVC